MSQEKETTSSKPRIISYVSRGDACFWYRNKIPLEALARRGWQTSNINMGEMMELSNVDIVQFSRVYINDFEEFLYYLKDQGKTIWYDIDDAVDLVTKFNPFSIENRKHMAAFYFMLNEADVITTTNENLKAHLARMTPKPIHISPNLLNPEEWKMVRPATSTKLRVGFAGSPSHIKEVNHILPVIAELQKHYDFDFVMLGMGSGATIHEWYESSKKQYASMWDKWEYTQELEKMYELLKKIPNLEWHTAVRWEMYPRKLAKLDLDIGLCPLLDDGFNVKKTAIKLYEYSMVNTVTLASNVSPFKEEALALTENDFNSWYDALDALLMHQELRDSTLKAQKEYVTKNKFIDPNIKNLEDILAPYGRTR